MPFGAMYGDYEDYINKQISIFRNSFEKPKIATETTPIYRNLLEELDSIADYRKNNVFMQL